MEHQLISVVDGSRARYFSVGTRVTPEGIEKSKLIEVETLINPANRLKDGDLFTESRPGLRSASGGAPGHAVDDKRDAHHDEADRKFAKLVLEKMSELIRESIKMYCTSAIGFVSSAWTRYQFAATSKRCACPATDGPISLPELS